MDDEPDISAGASVACPDDALVHEDGVCAACDDFADGGTHVLKAVYGSDGYAVVHWDDDGLAGVSVDYSFEPDFFADHGTVSNHITESGGD